MSEEAPSLEFAKPEFTYDELEVQLKAYKPDPQYENENEAISCLEESIRAGRMGNGFFPAKGDMAELAEIARTTAEEHGRDGAALDITGIHPGLFGEDMAGAVEEAAAWGLDRLVVPSFMFFRNPEESIAAMGEKIAPFVD